MIIKLLLIDDDKTLCRTLTQELEEYEEFKVINAAHDVESGLRAIESGAPDVVIMDMVMPKGDGMHILEELKANPIKYHGPEVIVLSALGEDKNTRNAIDLGAYCYFIKPFSMDVLIKRIRRAYSDKIGRRELIAVGRHQYQEKQASCLLNDLGVSAKLKGFTCLKRSLVILGEAKYDTVGLSKGLYPVLAKEYNTNPINVERNIRHAISAAWNNGMKEKYKKHLKRDISKRPANSEFIFSLAEHLRNYPD